MAKRKAKKKKLTALPDGFTIEEATVQLGRRTMRLEGPSLYQGDVIVRMTQAAWGKPVHVRAYVERGNGDFDSENIALTEDEIGAGVGTLFSQKNTTVRLSLGDVFGHQTDLEALKQIFRDELEPDMQSRFVPEVLPEATTDDDDHDFDPRFD